MFLEFLIAGSIAVIPPVEYRRDKINTVAFIHDHIERNKLCIELVQVVPPAGWEYQGCASKERNLILLPNPCDFKEESYARTVCHELGHTNGWPGDHPNGEEYKYPQILSH